MKDLVEVEALELRTPPIRSPNALTMFRNWGVDECIFWFVAEREQQQQDLQKLHPNLSHSIISCDPKNAHDTIKGKNITGAKMLHCTVHRELPPSAFTDHPGEVPVLCLIASVSASTAKPIVLATNVSLSHIGMGELSG